MNNSHVIYAKFKGPTNTRGAYVELSTYDVSHYCNNKIKKKKIPYLHSSDTYKQSIYSIESAGLQIIAMNDRHPEHIIFVCKWDFDILCTFFGVTNYASK